jgi:hypothetical protein
VDTSSLAVAQAPTGRVFNYLFQFAVNAGTAQDVSSLTVGAGALGDGHQAVPVTIQVAVAR